MEILFFLVVLFLSFSNGANDNFKGMATIWGSGILSYRKTLILANVTTALGVLASFFLGEKLLKTFSGNGIIDMSIMTGANFQLAFIIAAWATVFLATVLKFPISTTHAIIGSLLGASITRAGIDAVNGQTLLEKMILPLLFSPFIAITGTYVLYQVCKKFFPGHLQRSTPLLDKLHIFSGSIVTFARGINDAPKILSLLILSSSLPPSYGLTGIGIFMIAGGVIFSRGIAHVLSKEITGMTPSQGSIGNFITAIVVLSASKFGLPVSTTHVSVSSMFGIGIISAQAKKKKIIEIILSWVLTMPTGFAIASLLSLTILK